MPVLIAGRPAMSFPSVKKWTIHDPAESTACEFSALEVTESLAHARLELRLCATFLPYLQWGEAAMLSSQICMGDVSIAL